MSRELDNIFQRINEKTEKVEGVLKNGIEECLVLEEQLRQVEEDYLRVAEFCGQAGYVIDKIDRDFKAKTKLSDTDITLLFLCTALQCARQYLLPNSLFRFQDKGSLPSNQRADRFMKKVVSTPVDLIKPEWNDVLFQSVPYDALKKGDHVFETGLSGNTHRYRTLGHDPVLGWIFGTANIMTNSLTKHNFETFQVKNMIIIRHYPLGVGGMLNKAVQYAREDPKLLGASVARQAIHYGSDVLTKQGLPIPLIMTANNDLAKEMIIKYHIDTLNILRSAGIAAFINQLIFSIHRLFYNEDKDGTPAMYEVRTRKILSYSNLLASTSNVIVTAFTKDFSKLDIGGVLVTIYRLISDYNFINEIKRDFIKNELYNQVVGQPYDFMEEI